MTEFTGSKCKEMVVEILSRLSPFCFIKLISHQGFLQTMNSDARIHPDSEQAFADR